jgi:hypothetical protein
MVGCCKGDRMIVDDFMEFARRDPAGKKLVLEFARSHVFEYRALWRSGDCVNVNPMEHLPYSNMALAGTKINFGAEAGLIDILFFSAPVDLSAYQPDAQAQIADVLNGEGIAAKNAYEIHCYACRKKTFWALGVAVQSPGGMSSFVLPVQSNSESTDKEISRLVRSLALAFNEFIVLLNCKNVIESPVHPGRFKQRNRKRKGLRPLVSYKVLKVVKGKTVSRRIDHRGGGNDKRMHSCRGHYKEYTADKPLFGHTVGRVWCPAHVRGNKKLGAVVKSYEVSSSS